MTIDDRITEALRRITECMGPMRIPADPCDADLVLSDAKTELTALRAQLEAVARERDEARADAARLREALTQVRDARTEGLIAQLDRLLSPPESASGASAHRPGGETP